MQKLITLLALSLLLSACGKSELAQMSDYDLSEKYGHCLETKPTAPGFATACENMRKECERRKKELGSYICPVY